MTPEFQAAYEALARRCMEHGMSISMTPGPFGPDGYVGLIEITHFSWSEPMRRLLFPDGTLV